MSLKWIQLVTKLSGDVNFFISAIAISDLNVCKNNQNLSLPKLLFLSESIYYWNNIFFSFSRIQESDGGFFENLGTLLAEKARALEEVEGKKLILPISYGQCQNENKIKYADDKEEKDKENETNDKLTEALLESDSDRDENEEAMELVNDSVGWNVSIISIHIIITINKNIFHHQY